MTDEPQTRPASTAPAVADVLLPTFVTKRPDGLFVDLTAIDSRDLILRFLDRVFATGACFRDTDYATLQRLTCLSGASEMADWIARLEAAGRPPSARLAADIRPFPAERRALYRGFKIDPRAGVADYLFEPLEIEEPDPDAPPAADGTPATRTSLTVLDPDEFIAEAWSRGVRFGLDLPVVRGAIAAGRTQRLTVARMRPPEPGVDATLREETQALHRDDTPRILSDGRIDLAHFKNRFPQVVAGAVLLRKLPRRPGAPGWSLDGRLLESPPPKDFAIETVAGPGTRVERDGEGEVLVAAMDGFLSIDGQTQQVSVNDRIINREGVSVRTTGNLRLQGDAFEEHGEVQEQREVRGRDMTFFAPVHGEIVSDGGQVVFKERLSGGSARNTRGRICVEGAAAQATLIDPSGEIAVQQAENCLIVGDRVRVERAVQCEIVARELVIGQAEGCTLAARSARIDRLAARRGQPAQLLLLVPDLTPWAERARLLAARRAEAAAGVAALGAAQEALLADREMQTWMLLGRKLRCGELVMTPTQQAAWQKLQQQVAPQLRRLQHLRDQQAAARAGVDALDAEAARLADERAAAVAGIDCRILASDGELVVRTLPRADDAPALITLPPRELRHALRQADSAGEILLAEGGDAFAWSLAAALAAADAAAAAAADTPHAD